MQDQLLASLYLLPFVEVGSQFSKSDQFERRSRTFPFLRERSLYLIGFLLLYIPIYFNRNVKTVRFVGLMMMTQSISFICDSYLLVCLKELASSITYSFIGPLPEWTGIYLDIIKHSSTIFDILQHY